MFNLERGCSIPLVSSTKQPEDVEEEEFELEKAKAAALLQEKEDFLGQLEEHLATF